MAGRNMNRGKATPPYEWKHGWIPLTPGAALSKAKGSSKAADKLKVRHGITPASSKASSPQRNGGTSSSEAPGLARLREHTNDAAKGAGLPFRQGDTVRVRSVQGKDLGAGKLHGLSADGKYADVIYGSHSTPRRVSVNYIKPAGRPSSTTPSGLAKRDRIAGMSDSEVSSELTKSSNRGQTAEMLRAEKARRPNPMDKPRQPGIDSASRSDKSRAKVRDLPAGDSFKGIHSETYKGERLTVRKGREFGKLDVQINGQSVGTVYGTKNSDAVKHLDALRGNVDHAKDNPGNYTNGFGETTYGMKLGKPAAPAALPAVDPRAAALREAAAKKRAEAAGIADRAGVDDPQAFRLNPRALRQAHKNTDSSLRRYTEKQQQARALESKAYLAEGRAKEASRTRLTRADVEGATHIVDQHGQPREVVRVNAKTVTVKTPYSWTETVPIEKIRRAIKATPEQIEAAKRKAALRVVR